MREPADAGTLLVKEARDPPILPVGWLVREDVRVVEIEGGEAARVHFPYDPAAVRSFREHFKRASWRPAKRYWRVPGKTAATRARTWAETWPSLDPHEADRLRDELQHFEPLVPAGASPDWLRLNDDVIVVVAGNIDLEVPLRAVPLARRTRSPRYGWRWRIPYRRVSVAVLREVFASIVERLGP